MEDNTPTNVIVNRQTGPAAGEMVIPEAVIEEIREDLAGLDIGGMAQTEEEKELFRYMRKRGQLQSEIDRITQNAADMVKGLERDIGFLDFLFRKSAENTAAKLLKGKKTKTLKTPFGSASFRTINARIFIAEQAAFMAAAASKMEYMGLIVQRDPEPSQSALSEYFKETGDVPPGCQVYDKYEKFDVKP